MTLSVIDTGHTVEGVISRERKGLGWKCQECGDPGTLRYVYFLCSDSNLPNQPSSPSWFFPNAFTHYCSRCAEDHGLISPLHKNVKYWETQTGLKLRTIQKHCFTGEIPALILGRRLCIIPPENNPVDVSKFEYSLKTSFRGNSQSREYQIVLSPRPKDHGCSETAPLPDNTPMTVLSTEE